jgi:hypothetical protein
MSKLQGMKEIAAYLRCSESTAYNRIKFEDCPATTMGGIWVSETELIDKWWKDYCAPRKNGAKPDNQLERRAPAKRAAGKRF